MKAITKTRPTQSNIIHYTSVELKKPGMILLYLRQKIERDIKIAFLSKQPIGKGKFTFKWACMGAIKHEIDGINFSSREDALLAALSYDDLLLYFDRF